jgi:hypothetical protein
MRHHRITIREEAVRLKTVLRVIADTTPRGARADRSLIMLAYASMGLHFPGTAPTDTASLARCVSLLKMYPWMRERAFAFLGGLAGSAWPYLISKWDELARELDHETGCSIKSEAYAPKTYRRLHELTIQRCDKPFCSHPKDAHTHQEGDFKGRCSVAGCACGFFRAPHLDSSEPTKPASPRPHSTTSTEVTEEQCSQHPIQ